MSADFPFLRSSATPSRRRRPRTALPTALAEPPAPLVQHHANRNALAAERSPRLQSGTLRRARAAAAESSPPMFIFLRSLHRPDGAGRGPRWPSRPRRRRTSTPIARPSYAVEADRTRASQSAALRRCVVLSLSDFRLARSQSLSLGVAGSRIYRRWRAGSCPSFRPRRRRFLFAVMGGGRRCWCAIDGGARPR